MKYIITLIAIFSIVSCKSQTIYNLSTASDIKGENYYVKDIDNHYDAVVGTWKWEQGNSSFTITFQEFEKYNFPDFSTIYYDEIFGKYTYIKDRIIIAEVPLISGFPDFAINLSYKTPTKYSAFIRDISTNKSKTGEFILTSPTTATLKLWGTQGLTIIAPNNTQEFALPTNIILTKQ